MSYHYVCRDALGNLFMTTEKCSNEEEAKQYIGENKVLYPFIQEIYEVSYAQHKQLQKRISNMLRNMLPHTTLDDAKASKSSFDYDFTTHNEKSIAIVVDKPEDQKTSVTNNITNISKALQSITPHDAIVYRDTLGRWLLFRDEECHDIFDAHKQNVTDLAQALSLI